ncbi:hypothetical protein Cgig2_019200 [Carnegiea gigantea]|uniref:Uncharacterized protein n=1 Tax=Carnegiea gigantea TaxID=171969 RepID=A0A9Q1QBX5_9CARY|nr:hypothetical protein Cgig2_019200 [Carnegiea gigantea]
MAWCNAASERDSEDRKEPPTLGIKNSRHTAGLTLIRGSKVVEATKFRQAKEEATYQNYEDVHLQCEWKYSRLGCVEMMDDVISGELWSRNRHMEPHLQLQTFENDLRLYVHVEYAIVAIPKFLDFAQLFKNPCEEAVDPVLGRSESDRLGFWVFDEGLEAWVRKFGLNLWVPFERNGEGGELEIEIFRWFVEF